jgi:hypothetical protein
MKANSVAKANRLAIVFMGADDLEFQIYLQFSFFDAFPVMWNLK